jgi:structure-specific endonuclease subunit SLX1
MNHYVYILYSIENKRTYVGYTINPVRRILQHNGVLKGGAKYTCAFGPWVLFCLIGGFNDNIEALQAEWALKHVSKKRKTALQRLTDLDVLMNKEQFTSNSINLIKNIELTIKIDPEYYDFFLGKQYINKKIELL